MFRRSLKFFSTSRVPTFNDGIFHLSKESGFLPIVDPIRTLPQPFTPVQEILDQMPVKLTDGSAGLLATKGELPKAVLSSLPDLSKAIGPIVTSEAADDRRLTAALFRSYSFLASAFTLEASHHTIGENGKYGKATNYLPKQLALPLVRTADALGIHPWLDYHFAYSLCNYHVLEKKTTKEESMRWDNLAMCNRFSGETDEAGFILLHVHMNAHAPALVGAVLDSLKNSSSSSLSGYVKNAVASLTEINEVRKEMWSASRWRRYNDFRVFIMGVKGNDEIFGPGVFYEGVERFGGAPQQPRGQVKSTGAQDDIIPMIDTFLGITNFYPDNDLTRYLYDLRQYRPPVVRGFLEFVERESAASFHSAAHASPETALQCLLLAEQVYFFRLGHWQFVQRYILANTKYATATGGTPITTWIPNQIKATLKYMSHGISYLENQGEQDAEFKRVKDVQAKRVHKIEEQLKELQKDDYDVEKVYQLNEEETEGPKV